MLYSRIHTLEHRLLRKRKHKLLMARTHFQEHFQAHPLLLSRSSLLGKGKTNERKHTYRDIWIPSVLIAVPPSPPKSAHSTAPAAIIKSTGVHPESTRKPLTISYCGTYVSPICILRPYGRLSMITYMMTPYAPYLEAKYKKKLIRVKVKRTTKPFELVHSDLWVILFGGRRCYILYDYTSIWVLPGKKLNTCTSAYRSFQLF